MNFSTPEPVLRFRQGTRALLISMPHVGTYVPPELAARLTPQARQVSDTDWHLEQLYSFADALGASLLVATHSRYVIDLNRPPDDQNLYPGQDTTGLCPVDSFDKETLYASGCEPDAAEIDARRAAVWQPYHEQLKAELARLQAVHGVIALWDAHSIRSVLPRFFDGKLPDLNLGTANGASCDPALAQRMLEIATQASGYNAVLNGRFKGGYITRQYGAPSRGVHAIQLEMTQCSYMQEQLPFNYLPELASRIQPSVQAMLEAVLDYVESR